MDHAFGITEVMDFDLYQAVGPKDLFPMFSCKSFIFLRFTFKYVINFELTFA